MENEICSGALIGSHVPLSHFVSLSLSVSTRTQHWHDRNVYYALLLLLNDDIDIPRHRQTDVCIYVHI